eukprot:c16610_g1_i1 orf=60-365(-)
MASCKWIGSSNGKLQMRDSELEEAGQQQEVSILGGPVGCNGEDEVYKGSLKQEKLPQEECCIEDPPSSSFVGGSMCRVLVRRHSREIKGSQKSETLTLALY